ncbi:molybdopterin-dependent oxidoreductase, partial [Chloroflexota bacterium]
REDYGAESLAVVMGSSKGYQDGLLKRFANAFGTPNFASSAQVCSLPRMLGSQVTCGFMPVADYEYPPACLILWAFNPAETNAVHYRRLTRALDRGTRLIVIDPAKTKLASRADWWLRVRPGSDLALALAMINVIVNDGLYDRAFVDKWTVGFNELKAHVQDYSPERVSEITWVAADTIREIALFYATHRPACIELGNASEQNVNSFQTSRAVAILRAITGNLGVPGGESQNSPPPTVSRLSPGMVLEEKMPAEKWQKRVDADLALLPASLRYVLPQSVVRAILEEEPYPIRAAYIGGSNPLATWSNARRAYEALQKLDFLTVAEMFMTPTAELADIVLPAASYLEFDNVTGPTGWAVAQVQQKVASVGEAWSDIRILNELAKRMGMGEYFWTDEAEFLDAVLKPTGLTFDEFRQVGVIWGERLYRDYKANGFKTPSGKVELYSRRLEDAGFDPLPVYYELTETPMGSPKLAEEYPLLFITAKPAPYRHSGGRQISTLRDARPEPVISLNPETAAGLGIDDGDWVYIETMRGRIRQRARLDADLDPRVVHADYAWWFPEKGANGLYGWAESNINILTDDKLPYNREMGSPNMRGIFCKVYKE